MERRNPSAPRGIAAVLLLVLFLSFMPVQPAPTSFTPAPIVVVVQPPRYRRRRRRP